MPTTPTVQSCGITEEHPPQQPGGNHQGSNAVPSMSDELKAFRELLISDAAKLSQKLRENKDSIVAVHRANTQVLEEAKAALTATQTELASRTAAMKAEIGNKAAAIEQLHTDLAAKTAECEGLTAELAGTQQSSSAKLAALEAEKTALMTIVLQQSEKDAALKDLEKELTANQTSTSEKLTALEEGIVRQSQRRDTLAQQRMHMVQEEAERKVQRAASSQLRMCKKRGALMKKYKRVKRELRVQMQATRAQEMQRGIDADVHLSLTTANLRLERENLALREELGERTDLREKLHALGDSADAASALEHAKNKGKGKPNDKAIVAELERRFLHLQEYGLQELNIGRHAQNLLYLQFEQREYDGVMAQLASSITASERRQGAVLKQLETVFRFKKVYEDMFLAKQTCEGKAAVDALINLFAATKKLDASDASSFAAGQHAARLPARRGGGGLPLVTPRGDPTGRAPFVAPLQLPPAVPYTPRMGGDSATLATPPRTAAEHRDEAEAP